MVDQLSINSKIFMYLLDSFDNSITFTTLHTLRLDVFRPQNLKEIIFELKGHHNENEISNIKIDSRY